MKELMVFSVFDVKAGAFMTFWPAANEPVAIREFEQAVLADGSLFAKSPEDFILMHVADWDVESGMTVNGENRSVCRALDFVIAQAPLAVVGGE